MSIADPIATGWRAVFGEMVEGAHAAVLRFPVTAAAIFLLAGAANLIIADVELVGRSDDLLLALFVAAGASLAASLFAEPRRFAVPARIGWSLAAALLAFSLAWWHQSFGTFQPALAAAIAGLVLVAPYLGRGTGASFWLFGVRFAFAALLAGLALLLFAGGVSAVLLSLTFLFGLEVPDSLYEHVWASTGLFAAPLFGLGQLPRDFAAEPDANAQAFMDRGMRALGDFVAAPLFLIYASILHLYALKIVLTREAPEGEIGWLVLGFGFCTIGSLILVHPFLYAARAPTRLFLRIWPWLLIVPLILLFYAVWLRIGEYGVTPDRYFLALFGIAAGAILLLQIPSRTRGDIRYLAGLPVLALLFGSFGPQGAMETSIRSQTGRFRALVSEGPMEGARHDQALSALRFLLWNGAIGNAAPEGMAVARAGGERKEDDVLFRDIAAAHGIDPDITLAPDASFSRNYAQPAAFAASGFDVVIPSIALFKDTADAQVVALPSGERVSFSLDGNAIVVTRGEEQVRFAIATQEIKEIVSIQPPVRDRTTESPADPLLLEAGLRRLMIVPTNIYGETQGKPVINSISGAVLLRSADWRPLTQRAEPSRR